MPREYQNSPHSSGDGWAAALPFLNLHRRAVLVWTVDIAISIENFHVAVDMPCHWREQATNGQDNFVVEKGAKAEESAYSDR